MAHIKSNRTVFIKSKTLRLDKIPVFALHDDPGAARLMQCVNCESDE